MGDEEYERADTGRDDEPNLFRETKVSRANERGKAPFISYSIHNNLSCARACVCSMHPLYLKKNLNASRPSEHPLVRGKNV